MKRYLINSYLTFKINTCVKILIITRSLEGPMKNLLCLVGVHRWKENQRCHIRNLNHTHPFNLNTLTRRCLKCERVEKRLPTCNNKYKGWCKVVEI
jgi:hypothetical protein